jgi:hypothetical protein
MNFEMRYWETSLSRLRNLAAKIDQRVNDFEFAR